MRKSLFRKLGLLLGLCAVSVAAHAQTTETIPAGPPPAEAVLVVAAPGVQDIYLLIGQSNMQGVAEIGELDKKVLENVFLFNLLEQWEKATNTAHGINRYSSARRPKQSPKAPLMSPGHTFGRKVAEYSGRKIGLVSNALGGTRISWWQKGYTGENDFDLFEKAVARTKAALAASPGAQLKGILWHQGEGDNSTRAAAVYGEELSRLVSDLRADLNAPNAVFVAGEVGKWKGRGTGVNPVIRNVAQHVPRSDFASSDGLTSLNLPKNDPHFDTLSQRVLGERYADRILEMVYGISPGVVTLFAEPEYFGRSVVLRPGKYAAADLEKRGVLIDEVASIKVQAGTQIRLSSAEAEKGAVVIFADVPDLAAYSAGAQKVSIKQIEIE